MTTMRWCDDQERARRYSCPGRSGPALSSPVRNARRAELVELHHHARGVLHHNSVLTEVVVVPFCRMKGGSIGWHAAAGGHLREWPPLLGMVHVIN
jgi:hypothetical protein